MSASTQATLNEFEPVEQPNWTVDIPDDDSGGDVGIDNIHEVVRLWGDDYADILNSDELGGEGARENPYSVQRGGYYE